MVKTRSTNYSPGISELNRRKSTKMQGSNAPLKSNGSILIKRQQLSPENGIHAKNGEKPQSKKITFDETSLGKTHKTAYLVFVSLLLDLLAFTMILPLLPSLLDHYRMNDSAGLYQWLSNSIKYFQELCGAPEQFNSVLFGGALGSMYSFLQFIASPIVGGLSDVYGRRPVMIVCLVGIAFSYLIWAFSYNFALFVLARFVGGLSKGNVSLSMAIISDVSNDNNRGKGMALVGIAFSLGFIIGPVIGAFFALWADKSVQYWYMYPALFALLLSVSDLLFACLFIRETLPREKRARGIAMSLSRAMSFISVTDLFMFKAVQKIVPAELAELKRLGHVYFVYMFIYSGLEFTLTFLTHHTFGYTSMQQGKMFFVIGLIMAVLQGGIVRRIPAKSTYAAAEFGLWIIPISFVCVAMAAKKDILFLGYISALHFLYAGLFFFALSTAFVVSCLTILVSQLGGADQRGTVLGVFRSLGALARALGPIIASIVYWSLGAQLTYTMGAVCLLYPVLLLSYSHTSH